MSNRGSFRYNTVHVIIFNSTGVQCRCIHSTWKCWKNVRKNKTKRLRHLNSTNLIDMYNFHAIIVVFFCKILSRHKVYLHKKKKKLDSTYQFTNLYIAKYDSDCYQYEKEFGYVQISQKMENINDFLNYGKFLSKRKCLSGGRTDWLTDSQSSLSSFYNIDVHVGRGIVIIAVQCGLALALNLSQLRNNMVLFTWWF